MHVVPPYPRPWRVVRRDGAFASYPDLLSAVLTLPGDWNLGGFSPRVVDAFGAVQDRFGVVRDVGSFLVLDPDGVAVDPRLLMAHLMAHRRVHAGDGRATGRFRAGPWPRTGRRGRYRGCRSAMRTHQALAMAAAHDVEIAGYDHPHSGRRVREIRTTWDDVFRDPQRSWKLHRPRQWRERD